MPRSKKNEKELHWREILERQANSGLSIRGFCAAEGISQPSFYSWRKRLRAESLKPSTAEAPSDMQDEARQERLFLPLGMLDAAPTLEIIHPSGCRIRWTGDASPAALRRALEALDQRGAP